MNTLLKPRVLIVIGSLDLGGAEKHLLTILPHLLNHYDITIYVTAHRGLLEPDFISKGINVIGSTQKTALRQNPLSRFFRLSKRFSQLFFYLKNDSYDIIHFFLPGSYLLGGVAAVILKKKHLIMSRRSQNDYQQKHKIGAVIERKLHRHMDIIVGNSHKIVQQLKQEGVTDKQLRLIYNGVVIPDINDHAVHATLTLMIVANLIFYKGHADLLHALALIKDRLPEDWQLLCVGHDGGELKKLMTLTDSLELTAHIQWLGQRLDIPELTMMSDIGLLVSHEEGFSNAILEFMAAGKPMVVTDVGGNAEAITDGVCGLVVPTKQSEKLADAILTLAHNKELRLAYGHAARQRAIEYFSLQHCISGYNKLYADILKN